MTGAASDPSTTAGDAADARPTPEQAAFTAFCAANLWPGLGRTTAEALPGAGIRTAADVTEQRLASLPKIGPKRAGRLFSAFIAAAPALELCELLLSAGADPRLAGRAVDRFGGAAATLVRDDPWVFLSVTGVDVSTADRIARATLPGVQPDDPRRTRALVGWVLAGRARDGHTLTPRADVVAALAPLRTGDPDAAVEAALDHGTVVAFDDDTTGGADLSPARLGEAEDSVAGHIARLIEAAEPIPADPSTLSGRTGDLDAAQRSAVGNALAGGVSVLTGGPGTGKSRTVAAVVALAEQAGRSVALAAPTGRAAKRLEELCDAPASTVHRLLGAQGRRTGGDGEARRDFRASFARNEAFPLDEDVIVVDEASMLDVELADALLSAVPDGAHLLVVGDAAQLPSIGPGRVLGDLIDAGVVPTVELTTLYRQAEGGAIARLATAVRGGELPADAGDPDHEVVLVPARGSTEAAVRVKQLVTDSIPRALGIPVDQVQVVTPVHRGPAGTQALNAVLKAELNPGDGRRRFDPGDRIVATANHPEAEPAGFANGEVGVVESVTDGVVTVAFASGPAAVKGKVLADLQHGWAITVHRAQGSEFPAVVVVVPPESGGLLSRPLVYTALTRAQRHLSIVPAVGPALRRAVADIGATPRRTRLVAALRDEVGALG